MKPLELTSEQKDKLLKMCKILFPQYNITFNINALEYGTFIVINNGEIIIHWFEFCILHLADMIFSILDKLTNGTGLVTEEELFYAIISHNRHPVDYLYEQFLKLK